MCRLGKQHEVSTPEGSKLSAERYLRGMKKTLEQNLAQFFPDEYGDRPPNLSIEEPEIDSEIDVKEPAESPP